jgi:uncharacterized protein
LTTVLDQVRSELTVAMKARESERVSALRMVLAALQKAAKEGDGDEQAVLRRERKRRLESAGQFRVAGRDELAAAEEREAELIARYLPAELSDAELGELVAQALAETGASAPRDMGRVMGVAMSKVGGRADGRRVQERVREALH